MKSKRILGVIVFILLTGVLAFTLFMRDSSPDRLAVKNIENSGLGSGELELVNHIEEESGDIRLVYGDDVYNYTVNAKTGDIIKIHINDASRQKLDRALVESGGERIEEQQAQSLLNEILDKYFPNSVQTE